MLLVERDRLADCVGCPARPAGRAEPVFAGQADAHGKCGKGGQQVNQGVPRVPRGESDGGGHGRFGLTLLETLITLALSSFILAGISGAVRQFWIYRSAAQTNALLAETRRGIGEDLAVDLRSARQPLERREAPEVINRTALPLTEGDGAEIRDTPKPQNPELNFTKLIKFR